MKKEKRTEANILLKRVYDLSRSVPSIPSTHPVFEDIEDYLVCRGIAELNEERKEMFVTKSMCEFCKVRFSGCEYQYDSEDCRRDRKDYRSKDITEEKDGIRYRLNTRTGGCDTCNQESIRTALIISGCNYCDECGKELRGIKVE